MTEVITIRDVPDEVRAELAAQAGRAGQSLQEYLRALLIARAARPGVDDVIARARARVTATGSLLDARATLAARDADRFGSLPALAPTSIPVRPGQPS